MVSRSYANLLDLTESHPFDLPPVSRSLPKVMSEAHVLSNFSESDQTAINRNRGNDNNPSSPRVPQERSIIVSNTLPLCARKDECGSWSFTWDDNSLLLQMRDGYPKSTDVLYVGCITEEIDPSQREKVTGILLEKFNCVPVFVSSDLRHKYFDGFCKHQLWPLFHYMLPVTPEHGVRFDRSLWQAYVSVNKMFANKVMEVINPEEDYIWVHDYHLMALPTFLRKRFFKVKLGFFLHTPFPASEIYRTLPVREEILRGLLNADLIGFQTFDYARHFLSCCSRMLGIHFKTERGYIGLEYFGRTVGIKIMPVGIHMGRLMDTLAYAETQVKIDELKCHYKNKIIILGVDDLDIFQGISLKLLAMEQLLRENPEWRGKLVMVQIANPTSSQEVVEVQDEIHSTVMRINEEFGSEDYKPVVLIERPVSLVERTAYYTVSDCCIVTAVRDGLNLIPYEYTVCRHGSSKGGDDVADPISASKQSTLIISEFIGCSPSFSGAIRVNPWNIDNVAGAMLTALTLAGTEKEMRHEKHYKYVSTHDIVHWVQSFMGDLRKRCKTHSQRRCWGIGFGFGFRIVALDAGFRKLSFEHITSAYRRTKNRLILLDYDGTMVPCNAIDKTPTFEVISVLNSLCTDPSNLVFIVSGRSKDVLQDWFSPCKRLGLSAEHGFFNRWQQDQEWTTSVCISDFSWKEVVYPVLKRYTESTDGSSIEVKESALVWHYQDADPDFGSWQARELQDHLESMLANKPVVVKSGHYIVEVKPQGISKGTVAEELLLSLVKAGKPPEFVLCIGDDRSDEDMFESIATAMEGFPQAPLAEVFACTVGQKPSKAKYYVEDTVEVLKMLQELSTPSILQDGHLATNRNASQWTKFC
ncbi:hypothetical protein KP509_02G031900 [Ceratopteris richardii]|uniref:alpha,alpha-trehalose-phosphate synthase (UDP-forming) n=1 Tax=Ceratopteris richardii TaxID=49495 RepID=A0A8T2VCN0_CERRI|nr:hypothetical protein KP509_02G031900 [Ceratopteris richardii]KAH7443384.1 hypothetical protein KP509_02G031900 [Ceratopteris richardii]KAH7443385.1 hypothetical protein KP509_02G031900 [Ceratopteris richardii]